MLIGGGKRHEDRLSFGFVAGRRRTKMRRRCKPKSWIRSILERQDFPGVVADASTQEARCLSLHGASQNQNPGRGRLVRDALKHKQARLGNALYGSGFTIFVPGFDSDSLELQEIFPKEKLKAGAEEPRCVCASWGLL